MKIQLRRLKDGAQTAAHQEYDPKELDLEFVDLTYLKPVVMDGILERFKDTLTFRGQLKSRVEHICARCLKEVEEPIDYPFELVYDIKGKEELETVEDLREVLILEHPIRFLCQEECKGFCPQCGTNLNESACSCKSDSVETEQI